MLTNRDILIRYLALLEMVQSYLEDPNYGSSRDLLEEIKHEIRFVQHTLNRIDSSDEN